MLQNFKMLSILFGCLYSPVSLSGENLNFKNISIKSDQVTIDEANKQIIFKNNIQIKINSYFIKGSEALLSRENEKLQIYGNPATISSSTINGEAELFEIYPNKTMNLIGNAKLSNKENTITSNLIAYQISSNEY